MAVAHVASQFFDESGILQLVPVLIKNRAKKLACRQLQENPAKTNVFWQSRLVDQWELRKPIKALRVVRGRLFPGSQ